MPWPYANILRRLSAKRWERRCIESAEKIIVATDAMRDNLIEAYGREYNERITTVRHGYAPSCHPDGPKGTGVNPRECGGPLRIVYTGQLRGIDIDSASTTARIFQPLARALLRYTIGATFCEKLNIEWMSPLSLFKALAMAGKQDESFLNKIRLDFIGQKYPLIEIWKKQLGLESVVIQHGKNPPPIKPSKPPKTPTSYY